MIIKLDWPELLSCATIGVARRIESHRKGLKDRPGFKLVKEVWDIDINGACAELAVAKALGMYWPAGINSFHATDLEGIQVRLARQHRPYLVIQKDNPGEDKYVLVVGQAPRFEVAGWILGKNAKRFRFLRSFDGRPEVYAVAPHDLLPMESYVRT